MRELSPFLIWQTNPTTAQAQTQGYDLSHLNIHPIYALEHVKDPDPQTQRTAGIACPQPRSRLVTGSGFTPGSASPHSILPGYIHGNPKRPELGSPEGEEKRNWTQSPSGPMG
ncbi:hypothetical protein STEG23_014235 [Scotinomys teguina]